MITAIKERATVRENGAVEIFAPDLPVGTEVEVIVLVKEEMDTTEYLLSTEANRRHLEEALERSKNPENLIHFTMEEFEELCKK